MNIQKTLKFILALCLISLFHFSFFGFNFGKTNLIVHEWGTFTATHSANGKPQSGQRFAGRTLLPKEVYTLVDTTLNPKQKKSLRFRTESGYAVENGSEERAFHGISILNDTVRMETPVLYFYTDKELELDVNVIFPQGSIGEWYPKRNSGEKISFDHVDKKGFLVKSDETSYTSLDLKKYQGSISWKATILSPSENTPFTINTKSNEWISPRMTDSNLVKIGNEIEKYIFYRGIASFEIPIQTQFKKIESENFLEFKNKYSEKIPFVFVLKNPTNNPKTKTVLWKGNLNPNEKKELKLNDTKPIVFSEKDITEFKIALESEGLYPKEAEAMLNTWKESYFETKGITIFWIVPESLIQKLLPIEFSIQPHEFKRVFIGRIKIEN
ncbi:MAG TPA: hypothetical protein PK079_19340 [Leptospiraceae bacterium]|nr:hypothetical protein [Leptospiraceae bacterium]HMX34501.1 hypothetical protein [Leptospiraceae bacterium]HMY31126.1 hypothetical protein [Leptospiraceae bacterium]HMZ63709.1 hypothetical protein [Leptospiraceae bacterium]HNA09052.1 hypothetical protein [Leptospiraceae bacterium]